MQNKMECLTGVVGLTQETCACLTSGESCDFTTSPSGLYLDQIEGGLSLAAIKNMDACKSLCDMMLRARTQAERRLGDDISSALATKYAANKKSFVGKIGQDNFTGSLSLTKQFAGLKLQSVVGNADSLLVIKTMSININIDAHVQVKIIRARRGATSGTVVATLDVNASANLPTLFPIANDIKLPLSYDGEDVNYFILYDRSAGFNPKNNKSSCGCGNTEKYLFQYLSISGAVTDGLDALANTGYENVSHGLILGIELKCDKGEFVCREFNENDAVSITLAYATMYKAAEILIEEVLRSPEVSRFTMMNREYMWGKRNHFRKEYDDRIRYVASIIDPSASDCFICKPENIFSGGIMS